MTRFAARIARRMTALLPVLLAPIATGGCGPATPGAADPNPDVVLSRLSPGIVLASEEAPAWTLADRMADASAPAVAVTFVNASGSGWTRAAGVLRSGEEKPATGDTRFMAKSLAKPVTAFAALRLVDQGILDLDAPLDDYLVRWRIPDNEFTRATAPTLRLLLAHRAGFTMWGVPSYAPDEPRPTLVELLHGDVPDDYSPISIDYQPGTDSRYSGGGYSVLQLLLQDVSGEPFPTLMRRLVLDPLGMNHSQFAPTVPDSLKSVTAAGHEDGEPLPHWETLVQTAAGGLLSTAPDMGRFVAEVNRAWRGESDLLSKDLAREMLTDEGDGRGLGFELAGAGDSVVFRHTGAGDGFRTLIVGIPARGQGLIVMVNADDQQAGELREEIVRAAAVTYDWSRLEPEVRMTANLDSGWVERLPGRYEYTDGSVTTVAASSHGLLAAWGDAEPVPLFPTDSLHWFARSGEEFTFERRDGEVTGLVWSGSFGSFSAERQP